MMIGISPLLSSLFPLFPSSLPSLLFSSLLANPSCLLFLLLLYAVMMTRCYNTSRTAIPQLVPRSNSVPAVAPSSADAVLSTPPVPATGKISLPLSPSPPHPLAPSYSLLLSSRVASWYPEGLPSLGRRHLQSPRRLSPSHPESPVQKRVVSLFPYLDVVCCYIFKCEVQMLGLMLGLMLCKSVVKAESSVINNYLHNFYNMFTISIKRKDEIYKANPPLQNCHLFISLALSSTSPALSVISLALSCTSPALLFTSSALSSSSPCTT